MRKLGVFFLYRRKIWWDLKDVNISADQILIKGKEKAQKNPCKRFAKIKLCSGIEYIEE